MRTLFTLLLFGPFPLIILGQAPIRMSGGIFPYGRTDLYAEASNPAYCARNEQFQVGIRGHDRFLLPELALEGLQMVVPLKSGTAQITGTHYGNGSFRRVDLSLGYALPIGKRSVMGMRAGPSMVWIGEGHGRRRFWGGKIGLRSRIAHNIRGEVWISDPHAAFREPPVRGLLHPAMTIGAGKRWPGGNTWSVHLRKELDHPMLFRSRGSVRLHDRVYLISGVNAPPLTPLLGWSMNWDGFFLQLATTWEPTLGISPAFGLFYRSGG